MRRLIEVRRILRQRGVVRLVVPSIEHAIEIAAGRAQSQWPRHFQEPQPHRR